MVKFWQNIGIGLLSLTQTVAIADEVKKVQPNQEPSAEIPVEGDGVNAANQMTWDSYVDRSKNDDAATSASEGIKVEDILEKNYEYHYAAFGKEDPFKPPMLSATALAEAKLEIPIVSVLQKYRIEDLRIAGLWENRERERKVLIMTPKEEGVVAVVGDVIGQRGGRILSIDKQKVIVREFTLAADGTRNYTDVPMNIGDAVKDKAEVIVMQSGQGEEGYTKEELLPAGLLDNDPVVKAREEAAAANLKAAKLELEHQKLEEEKEKAEAAAEKGKTSEPEAKKPDAIPEANAAQQEKIENLQTDLENIEKQEEEKANQIPVEGGGEAVLEQPADAPKNEEVK